MERSVFAAISAASSSPALRSLAQEFSPRVEVCSDREVVLDLSGLTRLFGSAREIADEIRRDAADRGLRVRIAIAGTRTAARLLVQHRAGISIVEAGQEADVLAPLPLALLAGLAPGIDLPTLRRWGVTSLGEFAALPAAEVAARLRQRGVAWQRLARGQDPRPLLPAVREERFEQALDLEWPIEGLEPLSFVLGRLMEPLSAHLERRDRGAAVLHVRLQLVAKGEHGARLVHERSLELPTPIRDARTLRTLALLDLESHPPAAAIDRVTVAVDPTPGRIVQFSLITRPLPSPEQLSTLTARLDALMGQGRSGSPVPVDSWQPGAFQMQPFLPQEQEHTRRNGETENENVNNFLRSSVAPCEKSAAVVALRRFRIPVPARVRVEHGKPVRVMTDRRGMSGGAVETSAGPWRTSGAWWAGEAGEASSAGGPWDRDEWDVSLSDGATYRVFREREADAWFVEGVLD